jgi:hypothetical protein
MNQRTKDLWVIQSIIALATGIPLGAGFMFLGFGEQGRRYCDTAVVFSALVEGRAFASLPVWVTLVVLLVASVIAGLFLRHSHWSMTRMPLSWGDAPPHRQYFPVGETNPL